MDKYEIRVPKRNYFDDTGLVSVRSANLIESEAPRLECILSGWSLWLVTRADIRAFLLLKRSPVVT